MFSGIKWLDLHILQSTKGQHSSLSHRLGPARCLITLCFAILDSHSVAHTLFLKINTTIKGSTRMVKSHHFFTFSLQSSVQEKSKRSYVMANDFLLVLMLSGLPVPLFLECSAFLLPDFRESTIPYSDSEISLLVGAKIEWVSNVQPNAEAV